MPVSLSQQKEIIKQECLQFLYPRLEAQYEWNKKEFDLILEQYKNFLYLCVKYSGKNIPPSKDIDLLWHEHILYTKKYRDFCEKLFSGKKMIDHFPIENDQSNKKRTKKSFNEVQKLYKKEFGEYIYRIINPNPLRTIKMIFKILCSK